MYLSNATNENGLKWEATVLNLKPLLSTILHQVLHFVPMSTMANKQPMNINEASVIVMYKLQCLTKKTNQNKTNE